MTDSYCLWCNKSIRKEGSFRELFYVDDCLCASCRNQLSYNPRTIMIDDIKVQGLYVYKGMLRDILLQYKENNDEALFPVFLYPYVKALKRRYKGYTIVPVPSSQEMIRSRGFRHVNKMFSLLDLPVRDLLIKTENVEQKSNRYRKNIGKYFELNEDVKADTERILLVDDIVTSGESMKKCYGLLKEKYAEIKCLTVSYNNSFLTGANLFTKA